MEHEFIYVPDVVPVFPLPGVVLFPHMIQALLIFEPRYRAMISDVLLGERIFAVALLKPGYEPLYETRRAPIHKVIGIGQIVESEQVADGNYRLLLRGIGRAVVVDEVTDRAYRQAKIEPLHTFCADDERAREIRRELFGAIQKNPALDADLRRSWLKLRKSEISLDALADLVAAGTPVEAEVRQALLEEADAVARSTMLIENLRSLARVVRNQLRVPGPDEYHLN